MCRSKQIAVEHQQCSTECQSNFGLATLTHSTELLTVVQIGGSSRHGWVTLRLLIWQGASRMGRLAISQDPNVILRKTSVKFSQYWISQSRLLDCLRHIKRQNHTSIRPHTPPRFVCYLCMDINICAKYSTKCELGGTGLKILRHLTLKNSQYVGFKKILRQKLFKKGLAGV